MRADRLYSELLRHLESSYVAGDRLSMLVSLQTWLKGYVEALDTKTGGRWGLARFVELDFTRYPVDEAAFSPDDEYEVLKKLPPSSLEALSMRLRDIFWSGVTLETATICPNCDSVELRVLADMTAREVVLSCDLCAWRQFPTGRHWEGTRPLEPAPREMTDEWRRTGSPKRA